LGRLIQTSGDHYNRVVMASLSEELQSKLERVTSLGHPEQRVYGGNEFPLILTPTIDGSTVSNDFVRWRQWVSDNVDTLRGLLVHHGAILFRGFPIATATDFDLFSKAFGWTAFPYTAGVALRSHVVGNAFTSNESPSDEFIPLHQEMSYSANPPTVLFAWCEVTPASGGETPIALANAIYQRMFELEPEFVKRLADEGLFYERVVSENNDKTSATGRSWRETFSADDRQTAEKNAVLAGFRVEWLPGGSMRYVTNTPLPAIREDPRTGR